MPKRFKPDPLYPFSVTVKRADTVLVHEIIRAARETDAKLTIFDRHREIPLLDEEISVTAERCDA